MDNYRNIAMQWVAEAEHRPAVEAIAKHPESANVEAVAS